MSDTATAQPIQPAERASAVKERKYPCKSCGADLLFAPGQDSLKCPQCGHIEKIPRTAEEIKEYSFNDYLAKPKSTGFGAPSGQRREAKCSNCGAQIQLDASVRATKCPYCGSPMITDDDKADDVITPEGVVPFAITRAQAESKFIQWMASLWFAPEALKSESHLKQFQGIYRPYWTYDAHTMSHWTGERGVYYYVTETYTAVENGQNVTRTREVRHTRWTPCSGVYQDFFDDVLVRAGKTEDRSKDYDLKGVRHYESEYLSGFGAERYSLSVEDGWQTAKKAIDGSIYNSVRGQIGGDEQRVQGVQTAYSGITYKHILLPVWINSYQYLSQSYSFEVNGQSGVAQGTRPYSFWKIFGLVAGIAFVIGIILLIVALAHH
jgi:predicted RNA-binding Zn-ribbon protein involved in translation (DUF1610 family)